jgi:hypothetical protein
MRPAAILIAAVLAAAAVPASAADWTTSYGLMTLPDTAAAGPVRAPYTDDDGRVIGRFVAPKCIDCGAVLEGVWVETDSGRRCDTVQDGSEHWGRVTFEFDPAYTSFSGSWDYCGAGSGSSWRGEIGVTRLAPQASK